MRIDAARSDIRVRAYVEGFFSRLAHDLELVCRDVSGSADGTTATATIPIDGIAVAGVLKNGRVDADALSASFQREILEKMRREVFHAKAGEAVTVEATRERVTVKMPRGAAVTAKVDAAVTEADGATRVQGKVFLSLSALGSDPVKGPMNAFRMKDRVEARFDVVFQPA